MSSSGTSSPRSSNSTALSTRFGNDAAAEEGPSQLFVVFKVGGVEYALAANEVLQMESYSGATAVPGAQPFVSGVIRLRGRVVPVIDLRARFGLPPAPATLDSRVVVGEAKGRAVALIADSAREVVRISPAQEKPPPSLVDQAGFVRSIVQIDNRTILVLDFRKVIGAVDDETASASAPPEVAALAAAPAVEISAEKGQGST